MKSSLSLPISCFAKVVSSHAFLFCLDRRYMWAHPVTKQNLAQLQTWGYAVVDPAAKVLACGDVGHGALAAVPSIVQAVEGLVMHM